ncbi:MAG: HAD hydrolase-like protein [Pseudomonadota bacterium]
MTRPLAVFDLDGTLVETGPDLADSCNQVLAARGLPTVPHEVLSPFIGVGARKMIGGALKANGLSLDEATIDDIFGDYIDHYASRIARLSRPFPEMSAALDGLDDAGVTSAICTNKLETLAKLLITELGMTERFAFIAGSDTFGVSKPDPRHLTETIAAAGGSVTCMVYVGDSRVDRETAAAAGVPFVGIDYGYTDKPMRELAPERLLSRGDDVAAAILELMPPAH